MCYALKYGIWKEAQLDPASVNALVSGGYSPLTAMILAARGICNPKQAEAYLSHDGVLHDPMLLTDMAPAAARLRLALDRGEKIAIFGDYDVDGITATCLLTDFLRRQGGSCVPYIPGRLEEGYGLSSASIRQLAAEGCRLIVTVDCGITAIEEARLCKKLGVDLIITDHHECKTFLPNALAVVDPHRPDGGYPHKNLSGVGVAFKLASAICGSQAQVLRDYADMVALGTVADVMPLQGENRTFVAKGLAALQNTHRPGLAALMEQCSCDPKTLNASSVGYILAPRINAAGRMEKIELATQLFLTRDPEKAGEAAAALCELNRQRQAVESEIYDQVVQMLPQDHTPPAIVLAEESWHQGVVGIVASRIAEEYCCPTFLICLDGNKGKASSRSYGGFNLFGALTQLQKLLESYGGHELAAGFTISRENIPAFREAVCALAREYYSLDTPRTVLCADCAITPELLTLQSAESLSALEPCGNGCPKPVLTLHRVTVERTSQVGCGKHMRIQFRQGSHLWNGIYFSASPQSVYISQGDLVDVAFHPQVNEFRGTKSVQLNVIDIRPSCRAQCQWEMQAYKAFAEDTLDAASAQTLLPDRETLSDVWRYLALSQGPIREEPLCLCRKIVRWTDRDLSLAKLYTCLQIFADVGLLEAHRHSKYIDIRLQRNPQKRDLAESRTMQQLLAAKEQ